MGDKTKDEDADGDVGDALTSMEITAGSANCASSFCTGS